MSQPTTEDLRVIQDLYDRGRLYDAYRATQHLAPLRKWQDTAARVLAGRLAHQLGAARLADSLMLLAWRGARHDDNARYFGVRALWSRRGAVEAFDAMETLPAPNDPLIRAEWLALKGTLAGTFRDFARGEELLGQARMLAPDHHWIALEAAALLVAQDRLDEALDESRRAFAIQPLHPGTTLAKAQALLLLGRGDEAIEALQHGMQTLQAGSIATFLAAVLLERDRFDEALTAWECAQTLMPMMDASMRESMYGHLSHMQYLLGNIEESKRLAIESGNEHLKELTATLDQDKAAQHRRVRLDVPFILQHHVTCVPTTMAIIGRFWSVDLEHLAIADEITYGGTATHRERQWAEKHGWTVRELTVTWEAAVALIDRGIPFTLTTTGVERGHEQAVIGYDTHRRSLLIRDPSTPMLSEIDVKSLLESEQFSGPRGMVMIPATNPVSDLDLPESAERDLLYGIALALEEHRRADAESLHQQIPKGRIALLAREMLAAYDGDAAILLQVIDEALETEPGDTGLLLRKLHCLDGLFRTADRLQLLKDLANDEKRSPIFRRIYAASLSDSATEHPAALRILRDYFRLGAIDPEAMRILSNITWAEQRYDSAVAYYRLAAALDATNESLSSSYFIACVLRGRHDEALQFLRDRARRASGRSSLPARTLYWALTQLFRIDDALEVLQEAMTLRPNDGELMLFAADAYARYARPEADALLERAETRVRRRDFLAARAAIEAQRGHLQKSLADWREVHQLQPLSTAAHDAIADLIEQTEGPQAVVAFAESLIAAYPAYRFAHGLLARITRDLAPEQHERAVRRFLEVVPNDAWAHRELAEHLAMNTRFDEAIAEAEKARAIAPSDPSSVSVLGRTLLLAGRTEDARARFNEALEIFADDPTAIRLLASTASDAREREKLYRELFDVILRRSPYGEGIRIWYDCAVSFIAAETMLELTARAVAERPDWWQCHSTHIRHLVRMRRADEAVAQAKESVVRFGQQPLILLDAASAWRLVPDSMEEARALENALRLDATNGAAAFALARLVDRDGDRERAISILTASAAATPLDASIQRALGTLLWRNGDRENAAVRLSRAAKLSGEEAAWDDLSRLGDELGNPDLAIAIAKELVAEKPHNTDAWMSLAHVERELPARLAAIDKAIALDPRHEDAYDLKAVIYTEAGDFTNAFAVCEALGKGNDAPVSLRGRAAWIHAMRDELPVAVQKMQEVVRVSRDYSWGWYGICEWTRLIDQKHAYRQAAGELVRLDPTSAVAFNYLGEAERFLGNDVKAEDAFRTALSISPSNVFAALSLIDMQIAKKRFKHASELLDSCEPHSKAPDFRLRRLQIAVRTRQRNETAQIIRGIVTDESLQDDLVRKAIQENDADLRTILKEAVQAGTLHRIAAANYVRMLLDQVNPAAAIEVIKAMAAKQESNAVPAAYTFLDLSAARERREWFDAFRRAFPGWNQRNTEVWGIEGYCLLTQKRYHECADLLGNWANRDQVQPWMLLNLTLALRNLQRDADAALVNEYVIGMPRDHSTASHQVWVAYDLAIAGKLEKADRLISGVKFDELNEAHQQIGRLAWALVVARREQMTGNWRRAAMEQLELLLLPGASKLTATARRYYKDVIAALRTRYAHGMFDKVWAFWMARKV